MLKQRIAQLTSLLIIYNLLFSPNLVYSIENYVVKEFAVVLYSDGLVEVNYKIDVDPSRTRINISLIGNVFYDLIVTDNEGFLLNFHIINSTLTIVTLGSSRVCIDFITPDLTNKTGFLWNLSFKPPADATVQLPKETTILDLSPMPLAMVMTDIGIIVTVPPAPVSITYSLGSTGTKQQALLKIIEAENIIEDAKYHGYNISEAEKILENARQKFVLANYYDTEDLAEEAKIYVNTIIEQARKAESRIKEAEEAIYEAEMEGRTVLLQDANTFFKEANLKYNSGFYINSSMSAETARNLAIESTAPKFNNYFLLIPSALAVILIYIFYRQMKDPRKSNIGKNIYIEQILSDNQQLREDEKEVIRYISQKPEGVFTSELRDVFELPRSTAWRMIQRLEEKKIIATEFVGRETFIRISPKYRRKK